MMLLAQTDPAATGGGPLGLLVIALLGIVTVLLIRNMNKRLKKLPRSFDAPPPPSDDDAPPPPSAGSR
jgi:hypothetical protein